MSLRAVGVILAAGASSRMGRPKALLRLPDGRTFLERICATMRRGGCDLVVVVGGCHAAEIAAELPPGVLLVRNARWEDGQLSSARVGLAAALELGATRMALQVVDAPLIRPKDVRAVLARTTEGDATVACWRGERGHPLGLPHRVAVGIARERRAPTLRDALAKRASRIVEVEGSPGCVASANTPAERRRMLRGAPTPRAASRERPRRG